MNTHGKIESTSHQSFECYSSEFAFPHLQNSDYSTYGEVVLQPHNQGSKDLNPVSVFVRESGELTHNKYYQCFHDPAFGEKAVSNNCESSSGKLRAVSKVFLFNADDRVQNADRKGTLQPKTEELQLACSNTSIGNKSALPWGQLIGFKHGSQICSNMQHGGGTPGKQRIKWTNQLHEQFVAAVNSLGGAMKATPKGILGLMKTQGLTIFHIKSHLQKYRTAKCNPNFLEGKFGETTNQNLGPVSNIKGTGGIQISEALRLQMDVQKNLNQHLEFQKKLQARIEQHATYLQTMFEQQKMGYNILENANLERAIDLSVAESSSTRGYGG